MTSKEALDWLVNYLAPFHFHANKEKADKINNVLLTLRQDLERLESINKVWHDNEPMESVDINANHLQELYDLTNKLTQENEKLKQQVEDLENNQETVLTTLELAVNQNEKLEKAIENEIELLIERRFNAYACDDYETHNVLNTIIEELKEVLGNE